MTEDKAQPSRFRLLLDQIRLVPPSSSGWPSALRRGLLVGVIVVVGVLVGEFAIFSTIAVGALNLGLVDAPVPRRQLARTLVVVTIATALIAFVAAALAGTWWAIPLLMALAYTTGAIGSAGLVAFNATFMTLVTGVLFTNDPGDLRSSALLGLWVLIGSTIQAANALIAWRYEREASLRRGMVNMIAAIRSLAVETDSVPGNHLRAANAQMTVEQLINGAQLSPGRERRYRQVLQELTWTRLCLSNWISTGSPTPVEREYVAYYLDRVDAALRKRPGIAIRELPESDRAAAESAPDPSWQTLRKQLAALHVVALHFHAHIFRIGDEPLDDAPPTTPAAGDDQVKAVDKAAAAHQLRGYLSMLKPGSAGFRHASRLAVAVGFAEAIALAFNIERGYWIVLTVVMVVKPDFNTTLVRGILRVAGTAAAVIVGGIVLSATNNPQWLMVALVMIFAPLTMRWMTANYAFASFAVGSTVLLLIEAGDPGGVPIALRLLNTLIGAVIALAAYALWPRWSGDSVRQVLSTTISNQQRWTDVVLSGFVRGSYNADEARAAGDQARNAMLNARPAIEAAIVEPHRAECNAAAALGMLDACERTAMATLSIEIVLAHRSDTTTVDDTITNATRELTTHFDADFGAALALVTSGKPDSPTTASASATWTADGHRSTADGESHWPEPTSASSVDLLMSSADATVAAARQL